MITTDRAVFREALPEGGRLIGLDVGTKTIGTALVRRRLELREPRAA